MRTCSKCKVPKEDTEFHKKTKGYQSICKECRKDYIKAHYKKNKEKYLEKAIISRDKANDWYEAFKNTLKCEVCGEDHSACLDFHHTDPNEKEYSVAKLKNSKKKLLEEVKKCKVLCSNCHRKLHYDERNAPVA